MRKLAIAVAYCLLAVGAPARGSFKPSKAEQLPGGSLSGNTYANDALGVRWDFPTGWTASIDPETTRNLDPGHPSGRTCQCSKVLVWVTAPRRSEDRFASMAALIAIDPSCLTLTKFPQSAWDRATLNDFVDTVLHYFKRAPFFSPYNVKVIASPVPGPPPRVTIDLSGGMIINAILESNGHPAATKEPLTVNTWFSVTEWHGFWVALAYVADDASTEELKNTKPRFMDAQVP